MLHKITFIGLGSGGNQVADLTSQKEINSIAVNSTKIDTVGINHVKDIIYIGEEGCGKIRKNGKDLVKKSASNYIPKLAEYCSDSDLIIVGGGLGGGTCSGSAPITADLLRSYFKSQKKNPKIICCGILPDSGEDPRAQRNAIEAVKELASINMPYMLLDNSTVQGSPVTKYNTINNSIVEDIQILRGDYNLPSAYGNMDVKDSNQILSVPGLLTVNKISGFKKTSLDKEDFDSLILKSIKESYNVQLEKDKVIGRMGIIISLTEEMLEGFDRSIPKVKEELGVASEIYIHVNVVEDEKEASIITIVSGLSAPESRLEEMAEIITSAKESITKTSKADVDKIDSETNWLDLDDEEDGEDEDVPSFEDTLKNW